MIQKKVKNKLNFLQKKEILLWHHMNPSRHRKNKSYLPNKIKTNQLENLLIVRNLWKISNCKISISTRPILKARLILSKDSETVNENKLPWKMQG